MKLDFKAALNLWIAQTSRLYVFLPCLVSDNLISVVNQWKQEYVVYIKTSVECVLPSSGGFRLGPRPSPIPRIRPWREWREADDPLHLSRPSCTPALRSIAWSKCYIEEISFQPFFLGGGERVWFFMQKYYSCSVNRCVFWAVNTPKMRLRPRTPLGELTALPQTLALALPFGP